MESYTQYLMWMKKRQDFVMNSTNKSNKNSTSLSSSSWEEEAFADDKTERNVLGGFVWPPRSYICSFCKREFRSAQALGGHMNVHRRDRAKLKHSLIINPPTTTQALHLDQNHHTPSTTTSFAAPPSLFRAKKEEPILHNHEVECNGSKKLSFGIDLDEDVIRCKRHKVGPIKKDIDLELRLGYPPSNNKYK